MGHLVNADREYRLLQERMDHGVTAAPESPVLTKILKILFTPEDAVLARHVSTHPAPLADLARRTGISENELDDRLKDMARRGLVLDVEVRGEPHFALAPVLGGIFEFIFMRVREDVPLAELAALFDEYMNHDLNFGHAAYGGETQFARSFVREEAVPEGDHVEILDWERVSRVIETAKAWSIGLCACRHKMSHLNRTCDAPLRTCISLNGGAEAMIRMGISDRITAREALSVVEESKRLGLAQTGDNVQKSVTFLCNCCGCCCTLMQAIRTFNIRNAVVSSNWTRGIDAAKCKGCGKCVALCPLKAIDLVTRDGAAGACAEHDESLCLGCGVCYAACTCGAIQMKPRPQRVLTPEKAFEKTVRMAIERGKLTQVIFDQPERLSHRALARFLGILEKSPAGKAARAIKPLRSVFLDAVLKRARS